MTRNNTKSDVVVWETERVMYWQRETGRGQGVIIELTPVAWSNVNIVSGQ